ncbi:DUF4350 domain-containing protein [Ornithinibacillus sp. L9]|uniref:DUF4350 domain-containing protein n=2 Tax=Ornithinibacillus caprae TaxID=2678566 RepID=A0A6N8FMX5_9BACI|nr:DUF4350 domain-containing protein [Ornithinibacillus caprae]
MFVAVNYFLVSKQPQEYPSYVSESPSPTGVKAFYTYLQGETDAVERWSHEPHLLKKAENQQLLFMIEPFFVPEQKEMDGYISFMEAGNTIVLLDNNPDGMFGLKTEYVLEQDGPVEVRDGKEERYKASITSPVRMRASQNDEVLLSDQIGVVALKRSFGEGQLIVANAPNWITNEIILDEDHLQLITSLILEENQSWDTILFDEYIHVTGHGPKITSLYPKWIVVFALQSGLIAVSWLWNRGKRFGQVIRPREEVVRFSNERIKALASWYQRGRRYQDSLRIQADYVKLLLQERWGIPYRKEWIDCTDQLKVRRKQMTEDEILSFVKEITKLLNKESINKQEYVLWSKRMDQLQKEVEEG